MYLKGFAVFLIITFFSVFLPLQVHAAQLGVGLGRNVYTKSHVDDLGYPWVFNWGAGDTVGNGNDPSVDFPGRYIPMLYGCGASEVSDLKDWITTKNYNSYVLVFNEPDRADQGNCSAATAAVVFKDLVDWKNASSSRAGIKFIVGGTIDVPTGWLSSFINAYRTNNGQANPPIQGIHFHIYPSVSSLDPEVNTASMTSNIDTWINWINQPAQDWLDTKENWITEYGVLYPSNWGVTMATTNTIFIDVTDYIQSQPRISRAAWYVYSYLDWEDRSLTALRYYNNTKDDGGATTKYNVYKNKCKDEGLCPVLPTQGLNGTCSLTNLKATWTLPNAAPYATEITVKDVTVPASPVTLGTSVHSSTSATFTTGSYHTAGHTYSIEARTKQTVIGGFKYSVVRTKQVVCPAITVKDTAIPNNLITNGIDPDLNCYFGKWCTWERNATSTENITSTGKIRISSTATSGDYGSCWIQWMQYAPDNSSYRMRGTYSSTTAFPTNVAFLQIEVPGNANFLSPGVYLNGLSGSFDRTFTIPAGTGSFAVKFCSWGTNLPAAADKQLNTLSVIKL